MNKKLLAVLFPAFLFACQSGRDPDPAGESNITGPAVTSESAALSDEVIEEIIYNYSSIVEIPALIKDLGVPYVNGFLIQTGNLEKYTNNIERAFLLGVFGIDLGYLNIYNQTTVLPVFYSDLKQLTDSLFLDHLFDFAQMEKLAGARSVTASPVLNYMQGFNRTDEYLRQERRTYLSSAIVSGLWIEGLYLLTRAAELNPDAEIKERIGEQKIILNDLIIILRNHERIHSEFATLTEKLAALKEEFDKVEIIYEVDEPQAIEHDGRLVIVQNQRSTVNIAEEQLRNITLMTSTIRDKLIL